ncbi:MAG: ChaN family lipoprotein [Phycisphaerales bacterium]
MTRIVLLVLAMCLAGCATATPKVAAPVIEPRAVALYDGRTGARVEWEAMTSAVSQADVLLIGENHGHPLGLPSAAALWDDVLSRSDRAVLALEFVERHEQADLDDYLAGITDEAAFTKAANRSPGNYPPAHRAMVEAAKKAKRPVIAANAPRRYVRLARTSGYDRLASLTPEQRRLFRIPDALPTGKYREEFDKVMSPMTHTPAVSMTSTQAPPPESESARRARLDSTFRSQSLWDWTMAESVAGAMAQGGPVVLVVGRFHVDHEGGLVQALRAMRPAARVVVLSYVNAAVPSALAETDRGRADFVAYVGPSAPE